MVMPNLSPVNYTLKLNSKTEYCCDTGNSEFDLTAYGFAPRGGLGNMMWRHSEVHPALGVGVLSNSHKDVLEPYDLELVSELYATADTNAFRNEYHETILNALHRAQTGIYDDTLVTYPKHKYLEIGLWNGSSYTEYRLYVELLGFSVAPVWKSNMMIMQTTLRLRVVDPIWYTRAAAYITWEVTNGGTGVPTGNTVLAYTGSIRRVKRFIVKLLYLGTGDVINPTVTNDRGESFTITGTLDTTDQYWLVDMVEGRCYEGTTYSDQVDVTGSKFSGDFFGIDSHTTDTITVTSPTAGGLITYNAYIDACKTEM